MQLYLGSTCFTIGVRLQNVFSTFPQWWKRIFPFSGKGSLFWKKNGNLFPPFFHGNQLILFRGKTFSMRKRVSFPRKRGWKKRFIPFPHQGKNFQPFSKEKDKWFAWFCWVKGSQQAYTYGKPSGVSASSSVGSSHVWLRHIPSHS